MTNLTAERLAYIDAIKAREEQRIIDHITSALDDNFTPLQRERLEEMVRRLLEVMK